MKTPSDLACPSYVAKNGAELFGIKNAEGDVHFLQETIVIDDTFVNEAKKGKPAEERFRFSGKCIKNGCHQWEQESQKCGLVEKLIRIIDKPVSQSLQKCPIREKCRWFKQEKEVACANCSEIFRNREVQFLSI